MAENELLRLKKRRGLLKASLTRFKSFLDNYIPERDYSILRIRFEKANSLLSEFENVHMAIELAENINDEESRQLFENNYYEHVAKAQEYLDSGRNSAVSTDSASANADIQAVLSQLSNLTSNDNSVKLPTITLPKFDGKYEEWLSFEDSFKALVHNNVKIQTAVSKDSALGLSTLIDTALKHIHSLQVLEQPVDGWDALLLHLIGSKVDKRTQMEWEKSLDRTNMPTLEQYLKFLRNRCHILEAVPKDVSNTTNQKQSNSNKVASSKTRQILFESQHKVKCHVCGENHNIQNCEKFKAMSHVERSESIKKAGLCFNCFRANHKVTACKASSCRKCDRRHHTMLHPNNSSDVSQGIEENTEQKEQGKIQGSKTASQTLSSRLDDTSQIILSTAMVDIADASAQYQPCRVILDAGSQSNFISERLCDRLKLPKNVVDIPIKGIGETLSHVKWSTKATIKSRSSAFTLKLNCLVISKLTDVLPSRNINRKALDIPANLRLVDSRFDQPAQIDMLIGAEYFYHLLCIGQVKLRSGAIVMQKTKFGWIISGKTGSLDPVSVDLCHFSRSTLDDAVQKFWETEEIPARKNLSPEEKQCEQHYKRTVKRLPSGRYSIGLPFNEQKGKLGESYGIALKRLQGLERRLSANLRLYEDYRKFLQDYESLGQMTELKQSNMQEGCFLPHHSVIKESSMTTKLRVVFDASAKTSSGISLNDTLLKGPVVQQNILAIIIRFCLHNIVFTADIQKMYRQIFIHPKDRPFQRILWRNNPEEAVRIYELNTVTYGMSPAPYLATRTLIQLSEDERRNYTEAAEIITRDLYVDDLLSGTETIEQAIALKTQITRLLSSGGFDLRKWASNHSQFIESMTTEHQNEHWCLEFSGTHKTLGILWNPKQDCFLYRVAMRQESTKLTKRLILSQVASLYDPVPTGPLGLLGPVIVKAKILLQGLWKLQLSWDESVPMEIHTAWKTLRDSLSEINNILFPRHVCMAQSVDLQLHGFADASEAAYGACMYVRSSNLAGSYQVLLLCSKSKVAPLKKLSIPRLELCAAVLLSQLCQTVLEAFNTTFSKVVLWSDSTITLHWIRTQLHRLKTFVTNRVAAIQETTATFNWRHVSSQDNPADLVSRGILPSNLVNSIWIHGLPWLLEDEHTWPSFTPTLAEIPEQQATINLKIERSCDILQQFSSIVVLCRVVAWCLRFIDNCRVEHRIQGMLSGSELNRAMSVIVKLVQVEAFTSEISQLEKGESLKIGDLVVLREDKTPPLYWPLGRVTALYPGQDGIVRVVEIKTTTGSYKRAVKNVARLPMNETL
nr:PREDICTED: uncharacterized protein LOC105667930 [Linepithema humile]